MRTVKNNQAPMGAAFRAAPIAFFVFLLSFLAPVPASARDFPSISDDSALRRSLELPLLRAPTNAVFAFKTERRELPDGSPVEIRVEGGKTEYIIVLARRGDGSFPVSSPGSWALYRRYSDGAPTRIRVFPIADPYCYLQFRPDGSGRTFLDSVVYGGYVSRSLVLPLSFERVIVEPLESLISMAGPAFPRRYFEPKPEDYADIRALSAAVRSRLGGLRYADDGAFDENGKLVFIESGEPQKGGGGVNCSGFVKWLVDGMLRPLGRNRLTINELKTPPLQRGNSFTEPYESIRDPFFGLDWTRNLAAAAGRALTGTHGADPREYEVRWTPVISTRVPGGDGSSSRAYPPYVEDCGFVPEGLKATLYALAVSEPGRMYLASINRDIGREVKLRQHYHTAALLPQLDEKGRFSIVVFESAVESNFDTFLARYAGHMLHLVRIPVEGSFDP